MTFFVWVMTFLGWFMTGHDFFRLVLQWVMTIDIKNKISMVMTFAAGFTMGNDFF